MKKDNKHNLCRSAALDFVEMRTASHSDSCYSTHSHDEFSFGVVDQGEASYINTRDNYHIRQKTTVTINSGDAHSCNPKGQSWSYRMLFIDSQWMAGVQRDVCEKMDYDYASFEQHLLTDERHFDAFSELFSMLLEEQNPLVAEGSLIEYCAQLFNPQIAFKTISAGDVNRVQQLIMDQLENQLTLDQLCEVAQLSPFHLIRSFKKHYGQSPHAYQLDQRIKRAQLLLKSGVGLAATANTLGFSDQSHFQRNFKKRTALTPRQYQQFFV